MNDDLTTEAQETEEEEQKKEFDFEGLQKTLSELPSHIRGSVVEGLQDVIARAQANEGAVEEEEEDEDEIPDGKDLEAMSRSEFMRLMSKTILKDVKKLVKPVEEKVERVSIETQKAELVKAFNEAKSKHPDFMEWREEMQALAKRYPDLMPEELYTLARSSDPEKAAKIDKQLAEKKSKEEEEKQSTMSEKQKFAGLPPKSGAKVSQPQKMDVNTALEKAWEETMSHLPPELVGG